jgi:hypothetical protein
MRSSDVRQIRPAYLVPQVSAHQLVLDRMVKHLRKLRWIGKEREAQRMFQALGDVRLQPFRLPSSSLQPCRADGEDRLPEQLGNACNYPLSYWVVRRR